MGWDNVRENLGRELEAARTLIGRIRAASPKARFLFVPGNHEHWLYYAAMYYPRIGIPWPTNKEVKKVGFKTDLAKQADSVLAFILKRVLHAQKYRMEVLNYNEHLEIGKITYIHGHQLTGYKNTISKYPNKNIVFGHFHTEHRETGNNGGDTSRVIQHTHVPCMTGLAPGYLKDKSTRWLNGFYIADVLPNGLFDGRVKKILGGKVMVP